MVKTKIIWSRQAKNKLYAILEADIRKGQGKEYSTGLFQKISKRIRLLKKYPYSGLSTSDDSVRGLIIESYLICYGIQDSLISIYTISEY